MELKHGEYRALLELVARAAVSVGRVEIPYMGSDMSPEEFDAMVARNEAASRTIKM